MFPFLEQSPLTKRHSLSTGFLNTADLEYTFIWLTKPLLSGKVSTILPSSQELIQSFSRDKDNIANSSGHSIGRENLGPQLSTQDTGYRYLSSQFSSNSTRSTRSFPPNLHTTREVQTQAQRYQQTLPTASLRYWISFPFLNFKCQPWSNFTAPWMDWTTPGDLHNRFRIFKQKYNLTFDGPSENKAEDKRRDYCCFRPAIKAKRFIIKLHGQVTPPRALTEHTAPVQRQVPPADKHKFQSNLMAVSGVETNTVLLIIKKINK